MNPTRAQYMSREISHRDYYRSIAHAAGVSFETSDMLPRIKACLDAGDKHLNNIPLSTWDASGATLAMNPSYRAAIKAHAGEIDSLAVRVCVLKAAAIEAAEGGA